MGAKDSKRACLSYEDAVKRISDAELKRVCEAFKRLSGGSQLLSPAVFTQNVLGEGVPAQVANWLYVACGGTPRGISQRELICGLVLLTRGTQEEKIKFLWTLYSNDAGSYVSRGEFQRALQLEGAPPHQAGKPGGWCERTVVSLFGVGQDRVSFEHFRAWISYNKEATVLSMWLLVHPCVSLSSELETPTFYQTLAGVTHLEETDICELEKCFWVLQGSGASGQLDMTCLTQLVSPPVPASVCPGLFRALDVNGDGHVDFKELCCGISAACRGPTAERLKFAFKMFDGDRDGVLGPQELRHMLDVLAFVCREAGGEPRPAEQELEALRPRLGKQHDLPQEEFLMWGLGEGTHAVSPLLELLFQVCHVALGLRPRCRHHERDIALGWLRREERRGYRVGQFWYLVGAQWWRAWTTYTSAGPSLGERCGCAPPVAQHTPPEEGIACDESFTTNSTNDEDADCNSLNGKDTCSLASSSGVSSGGGGSLGGGGGGGRRVPGAAVSVTPPQPPGPVDNSGLVCEPPGGARVLPLTGEGGSLRRDVALVQHRDFEMVPDSLWKALQHWYGGPLPLPRQVIRGEAADGVDLELYPLNLRILRHEQNAHHVPPANAWSSVVGGYGAAALSTAAGLSAVPPGAMACVQQARRYLAHTAAFSRLASVRQVADFLAQRLGLRPEELRLWLCPADGTPAVLLDDDTATLQQAGLADGDQVLLEVRNKDLTWPEELGALLDVERARGRSRSGTGLGAGTQTAVAPPPGATGLHNLGNTCFMNAALQAVSNTRPLTQYFRLDGGRLRELNAVNPLGTRGQVAKRYAELCRELWAGEQRSVAPLKMRWCVTRHAPHLGGGGQHDSQELLAWLLDALHEDLNRADTAPGRRRQYTELRDSAGRPDSEVASEAWLSHLERDHSVITDLFYGQLKSKVTCQSCGHESVRFDPFNLLSLPLPMEESCTLCEALVVRLDGSAPVRYALRLGAEARNAELKRQLAVMCGLAAHRLRLAEVSDSQIRRLLPDTARVAAYGCAPLELTAYEIADGTDAVCDEAGAECEEESGVPQTRSPEVSSTSALCMPNILCFKTNEHHHHHHQQQHPAIEMRRRQESVAEPDAELLPATVSAITTSPPQPTGGGGGYVIAVHRKSVRQDTYLLSQHKWRPALFGLPLLLARRPHTTCQQLYELVCRQVSRLLSPPPPAGQDNHAADCDDSLGYGFPFTLRQVQAGGRVCSRCPWTRFCRGCDIPCGGEPLPTAVHWVAIDWEPTALHLRYQSARERSFHEHESVALCRRQHTEPIDLDHCLRAFTSEERLEARYHCSGCDSKQPATKKLQIWRLPPVLIIHLKRFDYVNGKWIKTQKVVDFPFKDFDPTAYLASVPHETVSRHRELKRAGAGAGAGTATQDHESGRERLESTSLLRTPVLDEHLEDFHEHHLRPGEDALDIKYRLYAVVSHSGLLNGGHYVAYACNPSGTWYCYNDSSCREVAGPPTGGVGGAGDADTQRAARIDTSSAYILFYERNGLDYAPYLPDSSGHPDDQPGALQHHQLDDDDCENDLRKQLCSLS